MTAVPSQWACSQCGALNPESGRFCRQCGTRRVGASPEAVSPSVVPAIASPAGRAPFWQDAAFWEDVRQRAKRQVLPLAGVSLLGFLDFQLHAQAPIALLIIAIGAGLTLFFREALRWVMSRVKVPQSRLTWIQPLFFSVPAALYFLIRGSGTVASPALIGLAIASLPAALNYFLPRLDVSLKAFYETRNRLIPTSARPLVLVGLSLFVTFGLVHGNLADIDILFGSTASKASPPDSGKVLLTVVLNVLLAFAVLRSPSDQSGEQVG